MRKLVYTFVFAIVFFSIASCEDNSKATALLKESTEIAIQRTDSFLKVQKDSIAKARVAERRKADSLRRVDSLRRIYERNNFTISGKVGDKPATLTMRRNNDVDGVAGTFSCDGRSIRVSGTMNQNLYLSGKLQKDSVSSLRVSINLTEVEDKYSGSVTFNDDGNTYTRQAVMHRY